MSNTNQVQGALAALGVHLQMAHNSALYSGAQKQRIQDAFGQVTTLGISIQLNATEIDARPQADIDAVKTQCGTAASALDDALTNSERDDAIEDAFAAIGLANGLLAPGDQPML